MLERLRPGSPGGLHRARERQRMRWRSRQFADVLSGTAYWQDVLRFGEIEAMRRALLRARRPLDPPPGWRADSG